jgi:diphosphomevalonate decarboxylase
MTMDPIELDAPRRASARAGANFALIKYWGKRDTALNLPDVGSISLTLEALTTETTVVFDPALAADELILDGRPAPERASRISAFLDRLRARAGVAAHARVETGNNFPTAAGLASSASGFAALTVAVDAALGTHWDARTLSELSRIGSGSAARSIFGGFVEMARGERDDGSDSVAVSLAEASHWPLSVAVAISTRAEKAVGSTEGMQRTAETSPFYRSWVDHQPVDLAEARAAIGEKDFQRLAEVAEGSALAMHGLAMSARPGLLYFNATTMECLHRVRALRAEGVPVFFTVNAGPQVKAICEPEALATVRDALSAVSGVIDVVESGLGPGAIVTEAPADS